VRGVVLEKGAGEMVTLPQQEGRGARDAGGQRSHVLVRGRGTRQGGKGDEKEDLRMKTVAKYSKKGGDAKESGVRSFGDIFDWNAGGWKGLWCPVQSQWGEKEKDRWWESNEMRTWKKKGTGSDEGGGKWG